jgi:hypothetical protein
LIRGDRGDTQSWPWLLEDDEREGDEDVRLVLAASLLGTRVADLIGGGVLLAVGTDLT